MGDQRLRAELANLECYAFDEVPWTTPRPLAESRVAVVTTAGLRVGDDADWNPGDQSFTGRRPAPAAGLDEQLSGPNAADLGAFSGAANLVVLGGPNDGVLFPIPRDGLTLGRLPANDVVIDDPSVSRRHAEIISTHDSYLLRDLASSNGTFLTDRLIDTSDYGLQDGDHIRLGQSDVQLVFRFSGEATLKMAPRAGGAGGAGRSLTGAVFLRDWTGLTLDSLFERMQSMPPGGSESLAADAYVDIITYVLERNGFPAGGDELSTRFLNAVRVEGEEGPDVVPNFALVRVVGCLAGSAADGWRLADASAEVRTTDPEPSAGDELRAVQAIPLGEGAFRLMYVFPSPEAYVGHMVETKGLLIRGASDSAGDSLNVTSVQSLAPRCGRP